MLDIYEGMPHVFESVMFDSPESKEAMAKIEAVSRRLPGEVCAS